MTQPIRYLAAKALAICLALSLLQSCSGGGRGNEPSFSVYSVGDFEANLVINGNKYTNRYGFNPKDPTFYVNKFGELLKIEKNNEGICALFGNEFAISRSANIESQCSGWKFRKLPKKNGIDIYQGYCSGDFQVCPADFNNKPMLEYGINDRGGMVFVQFDPQAPDSRQYALRMGSPFLLN